MRTTDGKLIIILGVFFLLQPAWGYTPSVTASGTPIRFQNSKYNLVGNPTNQSGVSPSFFYQSVIRGLQRWRAASRHTIGFDYWQGTDPEIFETNHDYNGLSHIYFASAYQGQNPVYLDSQVIGMTQVWYGVDSGKILESDIVLNDIAYTFTENPADTHTQGWGKPKVYLDNVITHELGHAWGLSHTEHVHSTMFYVASPEQAHLSCDDQVGIRAHYGVMADAGTLSGRVVNAQGQGVFGAHVVAISRIRGNALASVLSGPNGNFRFESLEAGSYHLMIEPFFPAPQALPTYYHALENHQCSSGLFSRTFVKGAGNRLASFQVSSGGTTSAGTLSVQCTSYGEAAIGSAFGKSSMNTANTLVNGSSQGSAAVDGIPYSGALYYALQNVSGRIQIAALAYSLNSNARAFIEVVDAYGDSVFGTFSDIADSGNSGFQIPESRWVGEVPYGNYFIRVSRLYGGPSATPPFSDAENFFVLTASVEEGFPSDSTLPFQPRCRMDENFSSYQSPGAPPERQDLQGFGVCGTIRRDFDPMDYFSWMLPWGVMLLTAGLFRLRLADSALPS